MARVTVGKVFKLFSLRSEDSIFALLGALAHIIFWRCNHTLLLDTLEDLVRIIRTSNMFLISIACINAYVTLLIASLDDSGELVFLTAQSTREIIFPFFCGVIIAGRSGLYNTAVLYQFHDIVRGLRQEDSALLNEMSHLLLSGVFGILFSYFLINFYYYSFVEIYQVITGISHVAYQTLYPHHFFSLDSAITFIVLVIMALGTSLISMYFGLKDEKVSEVIIGSGSAQLNFLFVVLVLLVVI